MNRSTRRTQIEVGHSLWLHGTRAKEYTYLQSSEWDWKTCSGEARSRIGNVLEGGTSGGNEGRGSFSFRSCRKGSTSNDRRKNSQGYLSRWLWSDRRTWVGPILPVYKICADILVTSWYTGLNPRTSLQRVVAFRSINRCDGSTYSQQGTSYETNRGSRRKPHDCYIQNRYEIQF